VDPGRLDRDLRIVRELLAQPDQHRQRLLELAALPQLDRARQPFGCAHGIGFSIATHGMVTPSGIVTSNSSTASKP
jgi:hypothetical protein